MSAVASFLMMCVFLWAIMTGIFRYLAKSGLVFTLTTDSRNAEENKRRKEQALETQRNQAARLSRLWPAAIACFVIAIILFMLNS